ncbi:hypothetical protein D0T49_13055, partial [Paludibacter sp. 221]|uniref:hypothetical protein n=1 Tax=Paludibacter sp. 221 TaxID=2302939 RepID=UPI0019446FFE
MKKIILLSITLFVTILSTHAQLLSNGTILNGIPGSNVFLDGSTNFFSAGIGNNIGKGLVIPSVDLTTFEFTDVKEGFADGITFPTYFDGMIVYNSATGTTLTTG